MIHVVPNNDEEPHELAIDCACGVEIEDGVVVHAAYDAREYAEQEAERNGAPMPDHDGWAVVDTDSLSQYTWT